MSEQDELSVDGAQAAPGAEEQPRRAAEAPADEGGRDADAAARSDSAGIGAPAPAETAAAGEDREDRGAAPEDGDVEDAGGSAQEEPADDLTPDAGEEQGAVDAAEDGVAEDDPAGVGSAPDLTADEDLDAALEALLLVVDVPAGEELLADALDQPVARVRTALERLSASYTEAGRGFDLRRAGDGWRFYTRETFAPYVERYLLDGQRAKLTRAALETLAVIAYRQPVTRSRVAAVRGVNVDGVIRTLLARGLIEEAGTDADTGGHLYCTTELFLERLGLSSLKDLPPLAPLLPEVDAIDEA